MDRADFPRLAVLSSVARLRSFRAAARELGLSPSAVSHSVAKLEERLGVRLVARTTRAVSTTPEGERLLARIEPAFLEIDQAITETGLAAPVALGPLRIAAPMSAVHLVLMPQMAGFVAAHPGVVPEIVGDDGLSDLVAEGLDVTVRLGESLDADMIAVPASAPLTLAAVASPAYLARHGTPASPEDLSRHRAVHRRFPDGGLYRWEFSRAGRAVTVLPPAALVVNGDEMALAAAEDGIGIAMVLAPRAAPRLEEGRLVRVMEDWCPPFPGFHLAYPTRRQMRPALRAFVDHFRFR
ncbi:LysR family transcriptional regulator [Aurantimonas sp. Leaf443]|uniref:LysR family transcriptional regulator n=1 Tax=Aurantimonas sp. Leaf443 TaxID=1736378 RepID=UPI0006FB5120|nr:LysR family transcriptional regulator [Aurantimonas sp. Leaf443]KQT84084.1 transcriptional regulator [Aurantimonas sp. Leaf443]